jgi:hypothetical protein
LSDEAFRNGIEKFCAQHGDIYPGTNIVPIIRRYALVDDLAYPSAGEAWQIVLDEMRRSGGFYGKPNAQNPLVQKAIECVGWNDICTTDKPGVVRSHFMQVYESLVQREKERIVRR